jgi:hypothetical protein
MQRLTVAGTPREIQVQLWRIEVEALCLEAARRAMRTAVRCGR